MAGPEFKKLGLVHICICSCRIGNIVPTFCNIVVIEVNTFNWGCGKVLYTPLLPCLPSTYIFLNPYT